MEINENEITSFLDKMILSVREIIDDDKMINKCDIAQGIIGRYLEENNIVIHPCNTKEVISKDVVGHSFIVATLNNINYLIDPAYVQFKYDIGEDLYIDGLRCKSFSPYYYGNILNKETCDDLIDKGYMKLTEENAYFYGNSFYKTMTNIKDDYILNNISGDIFIKSFLKGNSSLKKYDYDEISDINNKAR